jgi:hypothetical protein
VCSSLLRYLTEILYLVKILTLDMTTHDGSSARKYRSRKEKPCDLCRRRRVCCVRDAEGDCALCSRRSIPCTFSSEPSPRKRRAIADERPKPADNTTEVNGQSNLQTHRSVERLVRSEGKYVGLSGTDDVYWVVDRDKGIGNDPAKEAYFKVCYVVLAQDFDPDT